MYAVVDIETSGSNFGKDRIIEIAIVLHDGKSIVSEYSSLINPETRISPFISSFTGISNDMVRNAPLFEDVAEEILSITDGKIFVAHNVRFDYGFLRAEFRKLGIDFQRKHICTVALARKIIPGHNSYSLGNISRDLGIPLYDRHRAFGDARATALLLEHLLHKDENHHILDAAKDEWETISFPNHINKEKIIVLPEESGIFYMYNENQEVIYIGKGKNIRHEVFKIFKNEKKDKRITPLTNEVVDITYEITGNELSASILESIEIRKINPPYNKPLLDRKYKYGIFAKMSEEGYYNMMIDFLHLDESPLLKFTSKTRAERVLNDIFRSFKIQPALKAIDEVVKYNEKVEQAVAKYVYPHLNFMIIEEGRTAGEKTVIWIENGIFRGIGYFDPNYVKNNIELLKSTIKPYTEYPDIRKSIQQYLHKNKKFLDLIKL
jgi:DNA polymerase-3 subunit epsilon